MAFLDNSGDIILDAVLTDTGRMRLARGDGTFKVAKFALGDDEINYELYNKNHPSGSAYYDLDILQTPVLEAFTNNTSMMNSKLMSIPRTNLLYLPIMKLYRDGNSSTNVSNDLAGTNGKFIVAVDEQTANRTNGDTPPGPGIMPQADGALSNAALKHSPFGIIDGFGTQPGGVSAFIRVDQGLDTTEINPNFSLAQDLVETQYMIQMDNRLGYLVSAGPIGGGQSGLQNFSAGTANSPGKVSFIDDDNIATYYVNLSTDPQFVADLQTWTDTDTTSIEGPRGTALVFSINSQLQLRQSNFLFGKLGKESQAWTVSPGTNNLTVHYIDTTIRVMGATTGYKIDIPVRYMKYVSGH